MAVLLNRSITISNGVQIAANLQWTLLVKLSYSHSLAIKLLDTGFCCPMKNRLVTKIMIDGSLYIYDAFDRFLFAQQWDNYTLQIYIYIYIYRYVYHKFLITFANVINELYYFSSAYILY